MGFVNERGAPSTQCNWDQGTISIQTNTLISDAAHKLALVGCVWHPTVKTGTINIRKVHFRCGAVTNATATIRVSLQNVSVTAGPPYQPDGTQDQYYDFAAGTLSANAINATGNLTADRAVDLSADSLGDANSRWLAVVFEFASGFGSDSVVVNSLGVASQSLSILGSVVVLDTAGSYAVVSNRLTNIVLECDDGTFAFLSDGLPALTATAFASVASNGAIRRAGLVFSVPTTRKIDRLSLVAAFPNGSTGTIDLYAPDGTTILRSVSIDDDAVQSTSVGWVRILFEPVTLLAGAQYRAVIEGTSTTALSLYYFDVSAAGHLDGVFLGQNAKWTQSATSSPTAPSWAETTTRQPFFGFATTAYLDGAHIVGG